MQVVGDLEDTALLVEVDGIDGEAHEAHVDAVARCDEQGRGGRQGAAQHEAAKALPEGCRQVDGEGGIGRFDDKCFLPRSGTFWMVLASSEFKRPPMTIVMPEGMLTVVDAERSAMPGIL